MNSDIAVWFPCVKAGTGSDVFTIRLAEALQKRGIRSEIAWLPHHAEYLPWLVKVPKPPSWATHVHINSWLHKRFIPYGLPVIVTSHLCVHDTALTKYKSHLQKLYHYFWVRYCEKNAFNLAAEITAVSLYTAKQNRKHFNIKNITAIHNWIDTDLFTPAENKKDNEKFKLLYVGNLSKRKGSELLPEIMKNLGGNFELYFTGDKVDFYAERILPENMIVLGHITNQIELIKLYQRSHVLLFPTRLEGFSLVVIEASSCGLPVITTNSSSLPEIIDDNNTGLLCEQDNIEAFTSAIKQLASNPIQLNEMGGKARRKAKICFSEAVQVEKYIELYTKLVIYR